MDRTIPSPAKWWGDLEGKLGYDRPEWRKRMVALSLFISDADKSVMDLGAGNLQLQRLLNEDVHYLPVDYKQTSVDTIVCDFNKKEFPAQKVDVIFAAGILEYIEDPAWFLKEISTHCRKLILSYKGREKYDKQPLYTAEIITMLNDLGFGMTGRNTSLDEWTLLACFEKITPGILCKQVACAGCGACANICPVDAISMTGDENGYLKPFVNSAKCISCGKCVHTCPALHRPVNYNAFDKPVCYATWAENSIRSISSSGGFFSVLSEYILSKGGRVFGAKWGKNFTCEICGTDDPDEIASMRYSKYVQSSTGYTFRETANCLMENWPVAYFGCPCEIAGLNNYLKEVGISETKKDALITIVLVCFCAPSGAYFHKYLEENFGIANVKNINFRDKSSRGWSPVSYKVELTSGEVLYPEYSNDTYQKAFHGVLARNDTCENCDYYKMPRQGDFSIGDFWGIDQHAPSWNDGKGTSLVLVNDKKAQKALDEIQSRFERIEEEPLSYAMHKGNRVDDSVRPGHPNRKYFQDMVKSKSFNESVEDALSGNHDIGLVVLLNQNLGNNITNYALYHVLNELGYRVLIIGAFDDRFVEQTEENLFMRFLRNPYPSYDVVPICRDKADLIQLNIKCKAFLTGSDQLFRPSFVEENNYFYCQDWVSGLKYKFSYGTSLGTDSFESDEKVRGKMAYLLGRFQRVSVRERLSVDLMRDCFGIDVDCVLDPVFLCPREDYEGMVKVGRLRIPERPYVGAYILDITEEKADVLKAVSGKLTHNEHVVITDFPESEQNFDVRLLHEVALEEWLAMIHDAEFFLTDSFHGICFALIFHKQFAVVYDKKNWRGFARIRDILERTGLSNRYLEHWDEDSIEKICSRKIDFQKVDALLEKEREKSLQWLKDSLSEIDTFRGNYDSQDVFLENCLETYQREEHIKADILRMNDHMKKLRSASFFDSVKSLSVDLVQNAKENALQVVGFGAGECFRRNLALMKKYAGMSYVCDNAPDKWGTDVGEGIRCISPKQLSEMKDVLVVIMVDSVKASFNILGELQELGIQKVTHIENWLDAING